MGFHFQYDFVFDRTIDKNSFKILNIIDEYTRERLIIYVGRKIKSTELLFKLSELLVMHGVPDYIKSDNGSEFAANLIRKWLERIGVKIFYIEPGSPWENGFME